MFCSKDEKGSVIAADTTYNLCNLWVTDNSYCNQRLVKTNTRKHPVFLGPILVHFTKYITTFSQFELETKLRGITKDIKKVGVDLEEAIWQVLKQIFPSSTPLFCVRHLQQRYEKKIEKLLSNTHSNAAERNNAKSGILIDLYRAREGGMYEYVLAESENKNGFFN